MKENLWTPVEDQGQRFLYFEQEDEELWVCVEIFVFGEMNFN